jgi:tripartite-type tricarboxylate transporter receptor subunit TctC
LVKLVQSATTTPAWKATLEKLGWTGVFLGGDQYKTFLEEDTQRIAAIIDSLGIKKK